MEVTGTTPLVMHNIEMADPTNPIVKEIRSITSKPAKDKTEEDALTVSRLEFMGGLYGPEPHGFLYLPTWNLVRSFENAARYWRKGATLIRAVSLLEDAARLEFGGPHDPGKLWDQAHIFAWTTVVGIQRNKTLRTRPIFRQWKCSTGLMLDEDAMDLEELQRIAERAGRVEGVGDARKLGRGRYTATIQ